MTIKQGEAINTQFTALKADIQKANETATAWKQTAAVIKDSLNRVLIKANDSIAFISKQNIFYQQEVERVKKQVWSDRRERRFTAAGILFATMGWLTLFALSTN